jgi:taurine dioxygenase
MGINAKHLTPTIGSELSGIDLNDAQAVEDAAQELRDWLTRRQVIFFRDQHMSPLSQARLATVFGKPEAVSSAFPAHPESEYVRQLVSAGSRTGTDVWHADQSWLSTPPAGAVLCAVDVPETGGDTMWASMTAAYERLDSSFQTYLRGLTAVHDWEVPDVVDAVMKQDPTGERYKQLRDSRRPAEHPLVATHPITGKHYINANSLYSTSIKGLAAEQSRDLLATLCRLAQVPEYQVRFAWRAGSVAVWDNFATQHYAVNDYHPYARRMHRVAFHLPS